MPNNVTNVMRFIGDEDIIVKLLENIESVDNNDTKVYIDFNKIIPMPEELHINPHGEIEFAIKWALKQIKLKQEDVAKLKGFDRLIAPLEAHNAYNSKSPLEFNDEEWGIFIQCLQNIRKHGHMSWYSWSIANWGTKWNAYSQSESNNEITFETAWSTPYPIFEKLSELYPDVRIVIYYADEDTGNNCGIIVYEKGKEVISHQPKDEEAVKFALNVRGITSPEDIRAYGYDPETFKYISGE